MAEKTKANIKFSNKLFKDFLHHPNEDLLFTVATYAQEVNLIIFQLSSDKSTGPNNLPTKILNYLKIKFLLTLQIYLISLLDQESSHPY